MIDFLLHFLTSFYRRAFVLLNACIPLRELCSLLSDGATVDTYNGNSIAFRTVIQLDGDLFTMIARSGDSEVLWNAHTARVTNLLAHISDQLNGVVRVLTWPVGVAMFGIVALSWWPESSFSMWGVKEWSHLLLINVLIPVGLAFLGQIPLLRRAAGKALLRTIPIWLGLQGRRGRIEALEAAAREQRQRRPALGL